MKTKILYGAVVVLVVVVVALVIALAVVAVKKDSDSDSDGSAVTADREVYTVPDCPLNPGSPTPDLDKAICVLDSYPLIDG